MHMHHAAKILELLSSSSQFYDG